MALLTLGGGLAVGVGVVIYFLTMTSGDRADYILAGVSLCHVCASSLAVALIVFYSERNISTDGLLAESNRFLSELVPAALARSLVPSSGDSAAPVTLAVQTSHHSDQLAAFYAVTDGVDTLRLKVFLNVRRLIVSYMVPVALAPDAKTTKARFNTSLEGAEHVGYTVTIFPKVDPIQGITRIKCQVNLDKHFLLDAPEKLFWSNDIAEMTRSVFKHYRIAVRNHANSQHT